jgi:hypothetical protein
MGRLQHSISVAFLPHDDPPPRRTYEPACRKSNERPYISDMNAQPIQDVNDGKPWSEMDLFDLRNSLAYGRPIEEVAGFLCRSGTVEEVKRKAEELGLLR